MGRDDCGNPVSWTQVVSVQDTVAPVLICPTHVTAEFQDQLGATVTYVVTAIDSCPGPIMPDCAPPSGSVFPIGTTMVSCTATDSVGNSSEFSAALEVLVRTVQIDIVPDSGANIGSNGLIRVAIFSALGFDASQVDVGSVVFAGAHAVKSALQEVNHDGQLDLVLQFRIEDTPLAAIYQQLVEDRPRSDPAG